MIREDIYAALFKRLESIKAFKTSSRLLKHFDDLPASEQPAIFQTQKNQTAKKQARGTPTKWELNCDIYVYAKAEHGQPSAPLLNELLDAIEEVIAPSPIDGKQTLGGLVEDCHIDGVVETDEGTLGEQAVAIVPIKIFVF